MSLRPAGMSDEDDDDDDYDGFSFSYDDDKIRPAPKVYSAEENLTEKNLAKDNLAKDNLAKENSTEDSLAEEGSTEESLSEAVSEGESAFTEYANYNDEDTIYDVEWRVSKACIKGNDLNLIEEFLKEKKDNANKFLQIEGWTLLLLAASSVQSKVISLLLTYGADPNKDKDGFTPLMALCSSTMGKSEDSLECLIILINANADANIKTKQRETALMFACKSQDEKFVTELIKYVKDIDICDSDGRTALSYSVRYNKPEIVKILLEHKADTSLKDRYYLSPKDIAETKGFVKIANMLGTEEDKLLNMCEITQITSWRDLFPNLYPPNEELLQYDISMLLYGMGLEKYGLLFRGMDLKTFLQLTENDLCCLGIDISVHREQFLENLAKFHKTEWSKRTINVKKSVPNTIYNGVMSLGNVNRQISVIIASFQYIKNNLVNAANENINLDPEQRKSYEEELRKTQKTLKLVKNEMIRFKKLAYKIDEEDDMDVPASYITSLKKNKSKWIITLSVALVVGLCLSKTTYVQKLCNEIRTY